MAASFLQAGTFDTNQSDLPISASITLPTNTNVVVVWAQAFVVDARQSIGTPTLGGVTAAFSLPANGSSASPHVLLVFVFDTPRSGAQTLQTQLPSYGNMYGHWAAYNSDAVGLRFDASSAFTGNGLTASPSTGSRTCPAGGLVVAGIFHSFVVTNMTATAGTLGTSAKYFDVGIANSYRATTGALSWGASAEAHAAWGGIAILGAESGGGGGGGLAPTIITQPNNATVTAGATATLTAVFGNSPTSFQWQRSTDAGANWTNISGATSASFTTPTTTVTGGTANNGDRYRCTATNASGSITTNAVVLTVNASGVLTITTEPLRNENGVLLANTTIHRAYAVLLSDVTTVVAVWNNPATNASGVMQLANAALTASPTILTTVGVGGTAAGAKVYVPA